MAEEPEDVVAAAAIDGGEVQPTGGKRGKAPAVERPYPRKTLEEALRVPRAIRENNNGNPWEPTQIAKSLNVGASAGNFFYLTAASRDYGLTEGTRDTALITITDLGRRVVYPGSAEEEARAKIDAFFNVDLFRQVVEYYGGSNLPGDEFVRNTLETRFALDPRVHDEFLDLFAKNCRYVGIGAEYTPGTAPAHGASRERPEVASRGVATDASHRGDDARPVCFVVMPFVERTDQYATGFFDEVFASLFKPAIENAGFEARTAQRQGSDVIHSTIVNELFDADLVLADLTEHNPNVLFELGVRMTAERPIALVRAKGTAAIFDVDNMLRVESYNPNLWPSTVEKDVAKITAHVMAAWDTRETQTPLIRLLRQK